MDGAALPPPHEVPQWRWLIAAILLGWAGSLVAVAAFASGTYRVGPLLVEMSVRPASSGTTELAVRAIPLDSTGLRPGAIEVDTHEGFLAFRGTVTDIAGEAFLVEAAKVTSNPKALATSIRDDGESAMQRFGLKVGLVTLAGGAGGGAAIALVGMRVRRVIQGAIAGVVLIGVLGLVAWQTYDINKFPETPFSPNVTQTLPGG